MICPKCKQEISDDIKFCSNCGNKINLNNNAKPKFKLTKYKIFLIVVGILILLLGGFNVYALNKNKAENPTETNEVAAVETNTDSKSDTNGKLEPEKIDSEDKAIERIKTYYENKYHETFNADDNVISNGVVKDGEIIGANELIGKSCYTFRAKGTKHAQYYINSENGNIYELLDTVPMSTGTVAEVLVPVGADDITIAEIKQDAENIGIRERNKINDSSNNNNNANTEQKQQQQQTNKYSLSTANINYTIQPITYSAAANVSKMDIRCSNLSNKAYVVMLTIKFFDSNNQVIGGQVSSGCNLDPNQSTIVHAMCGGNVKNFDHFSVDEGLIDNTEMYKQKQEVDAQYGFH